MVVLDNGSIHTSGVTKAALPALRRQRISLYELPPSSPERNAIEAAFTRYDDRLRASDSQ